MNMRQKFSSVWQRLIPIREGGEEIQNYVNRKRKFAYEIDMRDSSGKLQSYKNYFAYGSNLNISQMLRRCPDAVAIERATIKAARLDFNFYLDITPENKFNQQNISASMVHGAIYRINAKDERALDMYEGYPKFYKKVGLTAWDRYGNPICCFGYAMQRGFKKFELPSNEYYETCYAGFMDWHIPTNYLQNAWVRCAKELGEDIDAPIVSQK